MQKKADSNEHVKALPWGIVSGLFFGVALEKANVIFPLSLRNQFPFEDFLMMKVFLAASATGTVIFAALEQLGYIKRSATANRLGFNLLGGYGGNWVGGMILGAGIETAGACPGTMAAQLGAGSSRSNVQGFAPARWVVAGAFAGALLYGSSARLIKSVLPGYGERKASPVAQTYKGLSYPVVVTRARADPQATAIGGVMMAAAVGLELYRPNHSEAYGHFGLWDWHHPWDLAQTHFNPIQAGIFLGLCQLIAWYLTGHHLGASSSYMTASGLAVEAAVGTEKTPAVFLNHRGNSDFAQTGSMIGVVLGAYLSARLSGASIPSDSISNAERFFGSLLVIFGARVAGGCASGHGLTGIAKLSFSGLVTTAAMFAGGFLSSQIRPLLFG